MEVVKKPSPGRPTVATNEENIDKVKEIGKRPQFTCEEMVWEAGMSHGSVHIILTTKFNMRRVTARWVPHALTHALTAKQNQTRVDVAKQLYKIYEKKANSYKIR